MMALLWNKFGHQNLNSTVVIQGRPGFKNTDVKFTSSNSIIT